MAIRGNIDPTLRALSSMGRYQILQLFVIILGFLAPSYHILVNIFIGREVTWQQCAAPSNISNMAQHLHGVDWNSSSVTYGRCEIIVSKDNQSDDTLRYPCLFGYHFDFPKELSYRTEFDLVCDWKILGSLSQTSFVVGQSFGSLIGSFFSDRFGRKKVLVVSQLVIFVVGVAVGFAPAYPVVLCGKFIIGMMQQSIMATTLALCIEWFPAKRRSFTLIVGTVFWSMGCASLAPLAYVLKDYSWRYLQMTVSSVSAPIALLQLWFMDESLQWLLTNSRKDIATRVLERAARANHKEVNTVLRTLGSSTILTQELQTFTNPGSRQDGKETELRSVVTDKTTTNNTDDIPQDKKSREKLTLCDLFTNRRLLVNCLIMCLAWFTSSFSFMALYLMSTSLHGDRFLNFFFTALMELVPAAIFVFAIDRVGRKWTLRPMYMLAGSGLIVSGVCRMYHDDSTLKTLSVVAAMLAMVGTSAVCAGNGFYNPELFPTNIRTQALGLSVFVGRLGATLSTFVTDLADVAVWAPGALIGSFCFLVAGFMHFLPETKGRPLPTTVDDVEEWYT